MTLTSDLLELSQHLQTENLFATNEREQLQRLYSNIIVLAEQLNHSSWVLRRQKINLQQFWQQGNLGEYTDAYAINNQLEETKFVDSYKVFSYHDTKYGELLRYLHENPSLLAAVILEGDGCDGLEIDNVINLTVSSVYSNCTQQEDETAVLKIVKILLEKQVANCVNPRRMFSRTTTAFTKTYRQLCDSLFSARLFLTAALYEPIMRVLMEDEWFYDIDPDKALVRFPPHEKRKRFGEPGTPEHIVKLEEYRKEAVDKLYLLASRFINSIKSNIHCFPASLGWLISQVYRALTEQGQVSMQEIRTSCADLIFDRFICPAICDPEPFGITSDVPISHISRHNLMQMAKIIQVLAISQWEEIDPKVKDLYGRFDKGCMSSVLDLFFEGSWDEFIDQMREGGNNGGKYSDGSSQECAQSCVLMTTTEIRDMVGFLRNTASRLEDKTPGKQHLEMLLSALPVETPPSSENLVNPRGVITPTTPPIPQHPLANASPDSSRKSVFKSKGTKKKASSVLTPNMDDMIGPEASSDASSNSGPCDVLVVSIRHPSDCPGMLPEKKVLSSQCSVESKHTTFNITDSTPQSGDVTSAPPLVAPNPEIQEKRTRFSLSHDQESIGNASDYQEVISEAASSHSVEDEENELETDNFSDMISANVSGRGSPSISGRDTPLSQAGSVEENPATPHLPVPVPVTVRKENRVDVTDRFGKFEIKAELITERDEFQSTVSDTWSTDVLASDSEPPESNQVDRLEEVAEEISHPPFLPEPISEISETASDAWSTDVLASDTDEKHSELLKDLEQDLLVGAIDRETDGGSVGHEEGEEPHSLESDHLGMGAVGGGGAGSNNSSINPHSQHAVQSDSCEAFPDVFSEPHTPSHRSNTHDDPFQTASSSRKMYSSTPSCSSTSSFPNVSGHSTISLQLPPVSSHRQSSPRSGPAVGFSGLHDSLQIGGSMVHSSTGARSKVKDKDSRRKTRDSRGGGGIGGSGIGGGFGGGGFGGGGIGAGGLGNRGCSSIGSTSSIGGSLGAEDGGMADFDPLSSGGSSSGSSKGWKDGSVGRHHKDVHQSSLGTPGLDVSDLLSRPVPNTSTPVGPQRREKLSPTCSHPDSNQLRNSGINIWVSTNGQVSGNSQHSTVLSSHSSFDSNTESAFLHQQTSQISHHLSIESSSNQTASTNLNLRSLQTSSVNFASNSSDSGLGSSSTVFRPLSVDNHHRPTPLQVQNPGFNLVNKTTSNSNPTNSGFTLEQDSLSTNCDRKHQERNSGLSDVLKKDPLFEDRECEDGSLICSAESGGESVKLAEQQQNAGLTERRFSAALSFFDPFPSGLEEESTGDVKATRSSSSDLKEFNLKWDEAGERLSKPNGIMSATVVEESGKEEEEKLLFPVTEDETKLLRPRRDSSGSSSHSTSSLKGNVSQGETNAKDCGGDNISMISDDKEFPEEELGASSRSKKTGFLKSVRDKFHKAKKKSAKFEKDLIDVSEGDSPTSSKINILKEVPLSAAETTDDILAKYRNPKKPTSLTKNNNSPAVANNNILADGSASGASGASANNNNNKSDSEMVLRNAATSSNAGRSFSTSIADDEQRPFYDPDNVEHCPAFYDAKRKLRLVLSNGLMNCSWTQVHSSSPRSPVTNRENELTYLLKTQLAEAINLQSKDQVAQLYEVVRCVRPFDLDGCKKLMAAMKADYKARSPYIAYLIRCRNNLLARRSHLQRFLNRVNRDKEISRKHLANMSAQKFLDKREKQIWKFISDFKKLTMADEKIDLLECFLGHLYGDMSQDGLWKPASEQQLEDAKIAIERFVISRIYTAAMFPNGEGDIMRDQLLQQHLNKLSQVISPSHKDIRIPPMYHMECPWPAAQREIFSINAYKTPKDKIQCVLRCSKTILNLLSLANHKSVPAADDFLPVLIFVLIKANPFGLLSTIQYVNSFYGNRLHGEEHYWWMQLTSAVEFIKNMNYSP